MKRTEITFCGNSAFLSRLAAGLRECPLLRIAQLDCSPTLALNELKMICPDMIITEALDRDTLSTLLQSNAPTIVVISETDTLATVITSRCTINLANSDAIQFITKLASDELQPTSMDIHKEVSYDSTGCE